MIPLGAVAAWGPPPPAPPRRPRAPRPPGLEKESKLKRNRYLFSRLSTFVEHHNQHSHAVGASETDLGTSKDAEGRRESNKNLAHIYLPKYVLPSPAGLISDDYDIEVRPNTPTSVFRKLQQLEPIPEVKGGENAFLDLSSDVDEDCLSLADSMSSAASFAQQGAGPQASSRDDSASGPSGIPSLNREETQESTSESDGTGMAGGAETFARDGTGTALSPAPASHQPPPMPTSKSTPATNLSGLVCNVHRTTGREPHSLVGATTTILGDKLYVFGGRSLSRSRPQLTSDLYELDLISRHWTKLETRGDVPPPRYFHSVCALGDTKLVCYGGMSPVILPPGQAVPAPQQSPNGESQPEVAVMSDIHMYDVTTRNWTYLATGEAPQGRYAHCATILPSTGAWASSNAPLSALHHNASASTNPNHGSIGVSIEGTGGAEMIVVGGQDSGNHYIEQISVFNLRSLRWTSTTQLGKSCGAYRSVVSPLLGMAASRIGKGADKKGKINGAISDAKGSRDPAERGVSMLIYSNYNFLDVKLELQVRSPDGSLSERPMSGQFSPPGLRFPNGGVIDSHFVVSGTYLTSSKQEYALWALDLRNLTWSRIDAGGNIFSQGSWNRGILWHRRNTFVILGNRKRSLVEDYNHRRINFSNLCMVELEAFGLYDNPRRSAPMSGYISASSPVATPFIPSKPAPGGGRTHAAAAEALGRTALSLRELADMDFLAIGGERVPVNSRIVSRRWGPYFNQLLREGALAAQDAGDTATLRSDTATVRPHFHPHTGAASRNSSITITPSIGGLSTMTGTTLNSHTSDQYDSTQANGHNIALIESPDPRTLPPNTRLRTFYLPHTHLTLQALTHYLYTSSLPPPSHHLCTPQILCSLLQFARPYAVDGLVEATVERLHQVLDSRNAVAVFNAAAMAAGGGQALSADNTAAPGSAAAGEGDSSSTPASASREATDQDAGDHMRRLRINTSMQQRRVHNGGAHGSEDDTMSSTGSTATSMSTSTEASASDAEGGEPRSHHHQHRERAHEGVDAWEGGLSVVVGLQKRGLRGLMEGRRLRERGTSRSGGSGSGGGGGSSQTVPVTGSVHAPDPSVGLGIG